MEGPIRTPVYQQPTRTSQKTYQNSNTNPSSYRSLKNKYAEDDPYFYFFGSHRGRQFANVCYKDYFTDAFNELINESIIDSDCWALMKAGHFLTKEPDMVVDDLHWEVIDFIIQTALYHRELDNSSTSGVCMREIKKELYENRYIETAIDNVKKRIDDLFGEVTALINTPNVPIDPDTFPSTAFDTVIQALNTNLVGVIQTSCASERIALDDEKVKSIFNQVTSFLKSEHEKFLSSLRELSQELDKARNPPRTREENAALMTDYQNKFDQLSAKFFSSYRATILKSIKNALGSHFRFSYRATLQSSLFSQQLYENVYKKWHSLDTRVRNFYEANIVLMKEITTGNWTPVGVDEYDRIDFNDYNKYRFNLTKRNNKLLFASTLPKLVTNKTPHVWYTDYQGAHKKIGIKANYFGFNTEAKETRIKGVIDRIMRSKTQTEMKEVFNSIEDRDDNPGTLMYIKSELQKRGSNLHVRFMDSALTAERTAKRQSPTNQNYPPENQDENPTGQGGGGLFTPDDYKNFIELLYTTIYEYPYNEFPNPGPMEIVFASIPAEKILIPYTYREMFLNSDVPEFSFDVDRILNRIIGKVSDPAPNLSGGFYSFGDRQEVWRDESGKLYFLNDKVTGEKCWGTGFNGKDCNKFIMQCVISDDMEKCMKLISDKDSVFADALSSVNSMDVRIGLKLLNNFEFKTVGVTDRPDCNLNRKETVAEWTARQKREISTQFIEDLEKNTHFMKYLDAVVNRVNSQYPLLNRIAISNDRINCENSWLTQLGIPKRIEKSQREPQGNKVKLYISSLVGGKVTSQMGGYRKEINELPGLLTGGSGSVILSSPIPLGAQYGVVIKDSRENSGHSFLEEVMERALNSLKSKNLRLEDADYQKIKQEMQAHKELEVELLKKLGVLDKYNKFLRDYSIGDMSQDAQKKMVKGDQSLATLESLTREIESLQEEYRKNEYKLAGIVGGIGNLVLYQQK